MLQHLTKVEGQEQKHKLDNIGRVQGRKNAESKMEIHFKKVPAER